MEQKIEEMREEEMEALIAAAEIQRMLPIPANIEEYRAAKVMLTENPVWEKGRIMAHRVMRRHTGTTDENAQREMNRYKNGFTTHVETATALIMIECGVGNA